MEIEEVKKHIGKKVLIILKNNFKLTVIIPEFSGHSFEARDKFGNKATIECEMINLIYEQNENSKSL